MQRQSWRADVESNGHCTLYAKFKTESQLERPLATMSRHISIPIYRFRCANMHFPSNTHLRKNYLSKECNLCGAYLGDEVHYIFICPNLQTERAIFIETKYTNRPSIEKLVDLLKQCDEQRIQNLSKYLKKIEKSLD